MADNVQDLSTYAVYWATGARITGNAINTVDANNINAIKAKGVTPKHFGHQMDTTPLSLKKEISW